MKPESSADIRNFMLRKCAEKGIPVSGIFELTPRCNLRCKMCYVRLTPEQMAPLGRELTAKEWIDLAVQCKSAGMIFLLITGGEPTIRKDFCEIYEALAKMGFSIAVNTNGTNMTDEIKELWKKFPPSQVNITIYGVCREDYAELCSDGSAFDRVSDTLDWLEKEEILIHLNTTIVPSNYSKWTELEEFAKNRNLELRVTAYCFPPARRGECSGCSDYSRLSPEQAGELTALDIFYREGIDAIKRRAVDLGTPIQKSCELDNGEPIKCMAGSSQFWIAWNGKLTLCGMLSTPAFSIMEAGFDSAWQKMRKACSEIRLCPECANCPEEKSCMNCAAVTFAETGRFDGKPEYMCKLNRAYRETVLKIAAIDDANLNQN